jgi:ferritin-like metal-binding protein YciE
MTNQQRSDHQQLRLIFIYNLNRLYFGKRYLDGKMKELIESASFPNLQLALTEMWDDVRHQIGRMDEIWHMINETPSDEQCNPIKAIVNDDFFNCRESATPILKDIDIILYVQLLEHANITAYRMMKILGHTFQNQEIDQLLIECFDESVEDDRLFVMVTEEYIGKK